MVAGALGGVKGCNPVLTGRFVLVIWEKYPSEILPEIRMGSNLLMELRNCSNSGPGERRGSFSPFLGDNSDYGA